jgi:ATP-binding cassette subfamily F protein 3
LTGGKPAKSAAAPTPVIDRKTARQDGAARRAEVAPLRKSIKDAEQKLARLRNELAKLDNLLADPKLYDGAPERIIHLGKDKARFEGEIAKVEENWLSLSTALEEAVRV